MPTFDASGAAALTPRSRRSVLAGAIAAVGAGVAAALGRPAPAMAAAGSPLIIGSQANNAGTADTQLVTSSGVVAFKLLQNGTGTALMGYATHPDAGTRGVYGRTDSPFGSGVQGRNAAATTQTGCGVSAIGVNNHGLNASTGNADRNAVNAVNTSGGGTAVYGQTVNGTSVYGYATGGGTGLRGLSSTGYGAECTGGLYGLYATTASGTAVAGLANDTGGVGVYGNSLFGYAGQFDGRVAIAAYLDMNEMATPANPGADTARLFVRDNAGKTELCVIFPTGSVQVIKTEA